MKKYIIGLAIVLGFLTVTVVKAGPLYYLPSSQAGGVASTTATFVASGTTITGRFTSDGVEQVSYLVALGSSTTAPILSWVNQYSNNGTDWYTDTTGYASTTANYWAYGTTTGQTIISNGSDGVTKFIGRRIDVTNLGTTHTRTVFTVTGGNALIDIQRSLKNTVITTK